MFALIDVPEHSRSVLASRSHQRTIRRDGQGVNDSSVTNEVGSELAVGEIPNLDDLVPSSRDYQRLLGGGRETDARNPVVVLILLNGVLALTECVPQLDGLVATRRDDLSVVRRETNAENVALVRDEGS